MARQPVEVLFKMNHWLNTPAVQRAIGKAGSRVATKQFYIYRREARDLLGRKVKKAPPRPPGKPPRHRTNPGFKFIKGNYDFRKRRAVMGPILFKKQHGKGVPGVHEHGKRFPARFIVPNRSSRRLKSSKAKRAYMDKIRSGEIKPKRQKRIIKTIRYPKRPFSVAALNNVKDKLAEVWRNQVRGN